MRPRAALADLVNRLVTATDAGRVDWVRGDTEGTFFATFPGYAIDLKQGRDSDGDLEVVLTIYNKDGEVVETVYPSSLKAYLEAPWFSFRILYETARGKALGVDEAINAILKALPGPEEPEDEVPF